MYGDRKAYYILLALLLLGLTIGIRYPLVARAEADAGQASLLVMERESGRVLYQTEGYRRMPMASTTKIMTALVALSLCDDLHALHKVPSEAVGVEGSSVYLKEGESLSVYHLLCGLMLRSGNDCAEAIASILGKGKRSAFVAEMNARAEALGLTDTHFDNPSGLDGETHYTTCYDLACITAEAMKNEVFRSIVGAKSLRIPNADGGERVLINKNKMLSSLKGATGVKTGYTKKSGRCLVTACERDGMELICVVLRCADMWRVSGEAIERGFSEYRRVQILPDYAYVGRVKTDGGCYYGYAEQGFCYPLKEEELSLIRVRLEPNNAFSGEENGSELGKIKIFYDKDLLFSQKLFTINTERKTEYPSALRRVLDGYLMKDVL